MAKVAIMGFGTVGGGVYEIIKNSSLNAGGNVLEVGAVLDIRDFSSHPDAKLFTTNFDDIRDNDEISIVVEAMGGLHPAYEFSKALLEAGKSVVTSNKEVVATYGSELMELAAENKVYYLFEASVGGGIPIITPLCESLSANKVERICGILNGTTNYILSEMINKGESFEAALLKAQENGYAERNPAADIEGHDACRKIAILASLAWGEFVDYNKLPTEGITNIALADVALAKELGYAIKLIGYADKAQGDLYACVSPMLVSHSNPLSNVWDVFNAINVRGNYLGDAMFYGRGAGSHATASAVVADVFAAARYSEYVAPITVWNNSAAKLSDSFEFAYFIRTKSSDVAEYADSKVATIGDEYGFITKKISKNELSEILSKLESAHAVKVLAN